MPSARPAGYRHGVSESRARRVDCREPRSSSSSSSSYSFSVIHDRSPELTRPQGSSPEQRPGPQAKDQDLGVQTDRHRGGIGIRPARIMPPSMYVKHSFTFNCAALMPAATGAPQSGEVRSRVSTRGGGVGNRKTEADSRAHKGAECGAWKAGAGQYVRTPRACFACPHNRRSLGRVWRLGGGFFLFMRAARSRAASTAGNSAEHWYSARTYASAYLRGARTLRRRWHICVTYTYLLQTT